VVVGFWDDAYMPAVNQYVQVPPGETNPEKCRMVPCLGATPRTADSGPTLYPVAKKVQGSPDLAVIADWAYSLERALEKAATIDNEHQKRQLRPDRKVTEAPEPQAAAASNANEPDAAKERQGHWAVVQHREPYTSSEAAVVEVVESFPRRDKALKFAEGRADVAVHPNMFNEALEPGTKLVAWLEPQPKDENAEKLNRIIRHGPQEKLDRVPGSGRPAEEERQEPPLDVPAKGPGNEPATPREPASPGPDPGELKREPFRPVPVEKPPWPPKRVSEWAVVKVIDSEGKEGALFEVVALHESHGRADLSAILGTAVGKDLAVFPRSFEKGELKVGQWFKVESVQGEEKDPNARKIREMVEKTRATYLPRQTPTQGQERRQGFSPGL
jgi:hypothetical protein